MKFYILLIKAILTIMIHVISIYYPLIFQRGDLVVKQQRKRIKMNYSLSPVSLVPAYNVSLQSSGHGSLSGLRDLTMEEIDAIYGGLPSAREIWHFATRVGLAALGGGIAGAWTLTGVSALAGGPGLTPFGFGLGFAVGAVGGATGAVITTILLAH